MKTSLFLLLAFLHPAIMSAQLYLEIKITPRTRATYCEPVSIDISWKNNSDAKLMIYPPQKPTESRAVTLYVDDEPRVTLPFGVTASSYYIGKNWLDPGETSQGSTTILALDLTPGTHRIKAVADFRDAYRISPDHFQGRAESNTVEFTLEEPAGENRAAWQWAVNAAETKEQVPQQEMLRTCIALEKAQILSLYPNSIYAAWLVFPRFAEPENLDPALVTKLVQSELHPYGNSVPDPESADGWLEIGPGKPMARWQNAWAERILKNFPDFPYANRLELVIGLNYLVLGEPEKGLPRLQRLAARQETREGNWAKEFLTHWH